MEPFTAGSAVVGFIAGVLDIAEVVVEYTRNTVGANDEKESLLSEIDATNNLLKDLERKAKALQWENTHSSMEKLDGPLQRYRSVLEVAREKLRPAKTSVGKAAQQAVWHFQKGEFAEILLKISRIRSEFTMLLTLYHKILLPMGTDSSNIGEDLSTRMEDHQLHTLQRLDSMTSALREAN